MDYLKENNIKYLKMKVVNKVILNSFILYAKIILSMLISLYSVPLVLHALGASDFGLYNLVAGIIAMLAFLNSAMTVSTQRFMSVVMGSNDSEKLNSVYNVSIALHIIIGIVIVFLFEICSLFIFNGFLNVNPNRILVAKLIYQFLVISTFFTILSVPFDAVINSYEDMFVFSLIGVVESILRLLLAISLSYVFIDKLTFYGLGISFVAILVMILKFTYTHMKYKNLRLNFRYSFDYKLFKEMFSFAGWNTFGTVAMVGRNQGIAVLLNLFYGTIVNAAYGIANQINSLLGYFSSTLQQSINPQLMKSQGGQNKERLLSIAFMSSKFSVLVLSFFAIPSIIEMPFILKLWLKDVPENTMWFSRLILVLSIISQYSAGIMSAIQSVGKIKRYTIVTSLLLLMNLPLAYVFLKVGLPPYFVLFCFIAVEIVALGFRLFFAKKLVGFNIYTFFKEVILPTVMIMFISVFVSLFIVLHYPSTFARLVLVVSVCIAFSLLGYWFFVLSKSEKSLLKRIVMSVKDRKKL